MNANMELVDLGVVSEETKGQFPVSVTDENGKPAKFDPQYDPDITAEV